MSEMPISSHSREFVERVWEDRSVVGRAARAMLAPMEQLFRLAVARRNASYDATPARPAVLAALSVGNLTVGGTGKTPIAAWCAARLRIQGAHPAIVLRDYGDDEWRVHAILNPQSPIVVATDRCVGLETARARGADCAVLDDAFQHRRAPRIADLVLLSADKWNGTVRLLPAGPFREPLLALQRADVAVITVKAASDHEIASLQTAIARAAPNIAIAVVTLVPDTLRLATSLSQDAHDMLGHDHTLARSLSHPAEWLAGRDVSVLSAIGDPRAFEAQLLRAGAVFRRVHRFPDHHAFSAADAMRIARDAHGSSGVVCTLKDAVKLAPIWPREAAALWYLSQTVVVDRGAEALDRVFARVLAARAATTPTAG